MRKLLLFLSIALAFLVSVSAVSAALPDQYRRWSSAPAVTCSTGGGHVNLQLASQPVEWANLPANAQFTLTYSTNGSPGSVDGPFDAEDGTGSQVFGAFGGMSPAYPFTLSIKIETFINGVSVYQSTLTGNCTADGAGTSSVLNFSPSEPAYYRWSATPGATCTTNGSNIEVLMASQPVEWNLPVDAQVSFHYFANGVEYYLPSTLFDAPDGIGSQVFWSLLSTFPITYPVSFEFRMLTYVDGIVVYQSSYFATCGADGVGSVSVVHQVVSGVVSLGGCVVPLPGGSVQGRLLESTATYSAASLDAPTNITLPAGSAWFVIGGQNGFYRLWIACTATPLWVPAAAVSPNYSAPWNGAPLPASGA